MSAVLDDVAPIGVHALLAAWLGAGDWQLDFAHWAQADAMHWRVVLVADGTRALALLSDRVEDRPLRERIEARLRRPARWVVCGPAELDELLGAGSADFRALAQLGDAFAGAGDVTVTEELSPLQLAQQTHPVVRLLDSTLYDALQDGASDVHFETSARGLAIRYRIDGVMLAVRETEGTALAEQLVSRLKVMAELDIGERRLPQDGRFKLRVHGREIDFRLSIMPSVFGEDAVIRVLDRAQIEQAHGHLSLDALGFEAAMCEQIRTLAKLPHGMLLVTGPTGSGKTTTLYAAIGEINDGSDKIITIEDPVEYQLPGVVQIPVNEKKGLTFARGLRSVLRHDPDRVMVGEIRDAETAQIAVQAALTGHLVFSTVHANTAFDVIGRFMHMGLDLYNVVSALNGVLAQRLLRLNCAHCRTPFIPPRELLARMAVEPGQAFARGTGCGHCRGTGYRGRRAMAELLLLDDDLRDLIAERAPMGRIKEAARERGLRSLRESALAAVCRGETTFEELDRVTLAF
jgi:general secretion pathway protein E